MLASKDELFTRPSGGYTIARSVRLRSSATASFTRTPASASNRTTWTWSGWVKRGALSTDQVLMYGGFSGAANNTFRISSDNTIYFFRYDGSITWGLSTTQVFRDPAAWYHLVAVYDSTNATSSNRAKIYVNGVQITSFTSATYPSSSLQGDVNNTVLQAQGNNSASNYFDGYLTEINFIDGQALTPSSFGSTNAITGVWQPIKYTGTYGTNGFYLNFSDNSNNTATTIGKDYSGNGNNWTPNNISVTSGVTYDSMTDVPTLTSATAANYPVMNPLNTYSSITVGNANLQLTITEAAYRKSVATMAFPASGKCYVEANTSGGTDYFSYGIVTPDAPLSDAVGNTATGYGVITSTTNWDRKNNGTTSGNFWTTPTLPTSATLQIAVDTTNGKLWIGYNNVWLDGSGGLTGNPSAGTNATFTIDTTRTYLASFGGYKSNSIILNANFGQQSFNYTPPTGFVALNTYNLPASTITNGAAYMAATTYTGTGVTGRAVSNAVNGISMQPDLVWVKSRSSATYNELYDSVRGVSLRLFSNDTAAEVSFAPYGVTAFSSGGFSVSDITSSGYGVNENGVSYIGWQWKAGGTSASNTNGSITSTVSVGATQGFSVVTYTLNNSTFTVGHGLGVAPSMILVKDRDTTNNWDVYHVSVGAGYRLILNDTSAQSASSQVWNNTAPTSTVFSGNSAWWSNPSTSKMVAYCFAPVAGYSAFGSYTGNGSTDGPFVYTGFRPRWIMTKRAVGGISNWDIVDTSRDTYNLAGQGLNANTSNAEYTPASTGYPVDILSNGFKIRDSSNDTNASGSTFIYACFAEVPFKSALGR